MTKQTQLQTIESLDLSLGKIFNDFYIVPSYQREYVWEDKQVEQLLRDIHDVFPEDGQPMTEYFIGSLVVCPGDGGVLELIDGQQRMTTAYLFLCCVRDCLTVLNEKPPDILSPQIAATHMDDYGNEVPRYRVSLQYEDSLDVLERIARGNGDLSLIPQTTRSVTNILNAYETIRTFLTSEFSNNASEVRRFYAYFINRVKLVRIKTQDVTHALKVFETINDRGVGLDSMDLLKNLMFIKANKEDFDNLKDKWKALVDILHPNEKPLRFLRYFIFANYDVDRLREDEIYSWFVKNERLCGYATAPLDFVTSLRKSANAYINFVAGKNVDGSANRYLANLRHLSGSARQQLILLLAGKHLSISDFTELSHQLENLFFVYIITREPTKEFERRFAQWARELRKVTSRAELDTFIATYFLPAKENLAIRYELAFQELRESSIQKYRMRYILGKMAQYVNEMAYGDTEINLGQFVNSRDVEHILSQTPTEEVLAAFDKPEEIKDYIRRLGNMTLLEDSINRTIRNKPYVEKKEGYTQSHFLLTKTIAQPVQVGANTKIDRAVEGLITFDEWTSKSIEKRQEMLTRLAKRVWDMPREGQSTQ